MGFSFARFWVAIALLAPFTMACGARTIDAERSSNPPNEPSTPNNSARAETLGAIAPGEYCFNTDDSVFRVVVHNDNRVEAFGADAVYIDPNAERWAYGIYYELIDATLNGQTLQGKLLQSEKADLTESNVTWELQASTLVTPLRTYQLVDCNAVANDYPAGWGQGVGRPVSSTTAPAPASPTTLAGTARSGNVIQFQLEDVTSEFAPTASDILPLLDFDHSQTVQFEPGSNSTAIVQRNIRPKEGHTYELQARAGQVLHIGFTSYNNASALYLFAPTGAVMAREVNDALSVQLPLDGVYYITVATWDNNDSYDLTLQIP
ncbi:hypothetical protein H6G20_00660 [Desertifilum sp. FACHB-1129]|uniref:hypothetical protein n=1 Tax=Desertifilum TaxID=1185872 RepID=UPI00114D24C1|nr:MULTISPECIES: hypothetical protein [Desertifilum]MBD2310191.1 hypothetical protein [Desertifilum sp. FACHB-1129]MBD2322567.1 hypothetical protein [Desertifilum sp. FACHB-866]MBD2334620.1 hypothetical protein [Desertifilum sp. FACHB-868]MDA0210245.1 hypothetical protein [Cyanobacteria bacterium FC1]